MPHTPHGYFDDSTLRTDLTASGAFASVSIDVVDAQSRAATPGLAEALEVSTAAIAERFGAVDPVGKIRGFVVTATKT